MKRGTGLFRVEQNVIREVPPLWRWTVGKNFGALVGSWVGKGELLTCAQVETDPTKFPKTP